MIDVIIMFYGVLNAINILLFTICFNHKKKSLERVRKYKNKFNKDLLNSLHYFEINKGAYKIERVPQKLIELIKCYFLLNNIKSAYIKENYEHEVLLKTPILKLLIYSFIYNSIGCFFIFLAVIIINYYSEIYLQIIFYVIGIIFILFYIYNIKNVLFYIVNEEDLFQEILDNLEKQKSELKTDKIVEKFKKEYEKEEEERKNYLKNINDKLLRLENEKKENK